MSRYTDEQRERLIAKAEVYLAEDGLIPVDLETEMLCAGIDVETLTEELGV